MSSIQSNQGTDKARGLENAALQHLKHKAQQETPSTVTNPQATPQQQQPSVQPTTANDPNVAVKVELNQRVSAPTTSYSPSTVLTSKDILIIGNGAKVNIGGGTAGVDNSNDTTIIGNGAKVNISGGSVGVDNSNDTTIIGNGAKVNIDGGSVGVDNSRDTLIIGNGAKVNIKGGAVGVDNSRDTLIIENGAKVEINGSAASTSGGGSTIVIGSGQDVKIDGTVGLGNDGFTYKDGKLSVQLKDEKNQTYRWELNVKNQQDAETLIEKIKNELKEKKVTFDDLRRSVQSTQDLMKQRDDLLTKFKDNLNGNANGHNKPFNRHQTQLDLQMNLVKQLMQPQGKETEESLHSKMFKLTEQLNNLHNKDK